MPDGADDRPPTDHVYSKCSKFISGDLDEKKKTREGHVRVRSLIDSSEVREVPDVKLSSEYSRIFWRITFHSSAASVSAPRN